MKRSDPSRRVHDLVVHIVWAVRHRLPLLDEAEDTARSEFFKHRSFDAGAELLAIGCANDHVHVLVRIAATHRVADVVKRLKGASSRAENLTHPDRRFEWQEGYWCQSCDPHSLDGVVQYVRNQRAHHHAPTREPWEETLDATTARDASDNDG